MAGNSEGVYSTPNALDQIIEAVVEDFKVRGPIFQAVAGVICQGINMAFKEEAASDADLPLKN